MSAHYMSQAQVMEPLAALLAVKKVLRWATTGVMPSGKLVADAALAVQREVLRAPGAAATAAQQCLESLRAGMLPDQSVCKQACADVDRLIDRHENEPVDREGGPRNG